MNERAMIDSVLMTLRAGGAEGDAFLEQRRSLQMQVREGRLETINRAEVRGLGIRAILDGRLGFTHVSVSDAATIERAARQAIELARAASPREDLVLAKPAGPGDGRDEGEALGLYDSTLETRTLAEKEDWIRSAEAVARGFDPKITRTEGAGYNEDLTSIWLGNTEGLFRHQRRSHLNVGVQVIAEENGEMQPGETDGDAVSWDDLPDSGELGRRAGERAVRLLGGRPVATGRYPIVFSPSAGWPLLVYLSVALNGDHLSRRRSWLADRGAEPIGSPLVTVGDDGRLPGGPARSPFDGEGTDTQSTILVEQGLVTGRLTDLAAAHRLSEPSTGNAQRGGYEALPGIGTTNLYLKAGTDLPDRIIEGVDQGFWVWGLSGWWIGLDPSNPSFSSAAFGLWIDKGKPAQSVARVTIAGNVAEILRGVDAVCSDLVWDHTTKTPTFRVSGMSISGV